MAFTRLAATALALCMIGHAACAKPSIIVQSTTSTKNSGLYRYLLPKFEQTTGIRVHVVAVGTGQAIRNARNCDGDVLLVHAKADEEQFVRDGYADQRFDLMYNDFVFVGPTADPAKIGGRTTAKDALRKIATSNALFVSRGDNSGTHKKERALWTAAGVDPTGYSGRWYLETGSGMGTTLNIAVGMGAYTMTDRATWVAFKNKADFRIQVERHATLFNQYGIMTVSAMKCPSVKTELANRFSAWMRSAEGQAAIAGYAIAGQQLFFPNANGAE